MIERTYKHPSANEQEFTLKILKELNLNKYDANILGDMNIDLLRYHTRQQTGRCLDMLYSNDLLPVMTKPTKNRRSLTARLIDHIFTNTVNSLVSAIVHCNY